MVLIIVIHVSILQLDIPVAVDYELIYNHVVIESGTILANQSVDDKIWINNH